MKTILLFGEILFDRFPDGSIVLGLVRGWPMADTLARAQSLAGAVCGLRDAVSHDHGFYERFRQAWNMQ